MLSMETINKAAEESGFVRSASCCTDPLKFCNGDEWEGNLEGFAKALLRLATPSTSLAVRDGVDERYQDALDAERYRWLRDKSGADTATDGFWAESKFITDITDEAIDTAMKG